MTNNAKKVLIVELSDALKILICVTGEHTDAVQTIIDIFDSAHAIEDKAVALETHARKVLEAVAIARSMKATKQPVIGGVTRWGEDKITSIEFLSMQLLTVAAFACDAVKTQQSPSPSLVKLCELLNSEPNAIKTAMDQAKLFLKEMEPLHKVLLRFSDYCHAPLATSVFACLEDVAAHGRTLAAQGKPDFQNAFEHHARRLLDRHDMRFWERVRWLHPLVMQARRRLETLPTAAQMSEGLQVAFDESGWTKYCACVDFKWKGVSHEGEWWAGIGGEMFPPLKDLAFSLIWVPTVVTQCDGMLSILGAKFNKRQARLGPHVAANQIFMRCNWRHLLPSKRNEDPNVTDTSSSEDEQEDA